MTLFRSILFLFLLCSTSLSFSAENAKKQSNRHYANGHDSEYSGNRSEKHIKTALLSKGFAWLSGSPADNAILSIGKTSQFFGFVALRKESGRSARRGNIGNAFYQIATQEQREIILQGVKKEASTLKKWWQVRNQIQAQLEQQLATGKTPDPKHMEALARQFGWLNAQSGLRDAQAIAKLEHTLSQQQWKTLRNIRKNPDIANQMATQNRPIKNLSNLSKEEIKQYENLFAKAFSWLTGSFEDRQIIPRGQPAQFFGFVAIRQKSGHGASRGKIAKRFGAILNHQQKSVINRASRKISPWVNSFIATRNQLLHEQEKLRIGDQQFDQSKYQKLAERLGVLEIICATIEADAYQNIGATMSDKQHTKMMAIRSDYILHSDPNIAPGMLARGKTIMNLCSSCHNSNTKIGPSLSGIVGRKIASRDYAYSAALKKYAEAENIWTEENLQLFLQKPSKVAPGTIMGFSGLEDAKDREAIIQYLKKH